MIDINEVIRAIKEIEDTLQHTMLEEVKKVTSTPLLLNFCKEKGIHIEDVAAIIEEDFSIFLDVNEFLDDVKENEAIYKELDDIED